MSAPEHAFVKRSDDPEFWATFFAARPDVLGRFLGDIYTITRSQAGQRTAAGEGSIEELWDMLAPKFSFEPFGPACTKLMAGQSLRQFAVKIPMHHYQLSRLISGEQNVVRPVDPAGGMYQLDRIARAGRVHPSYFLEWRQQYVMQMVAHAIDQAPHQGVELFRRFVAMSGSA